MAQDGNLAAFVSLPSFFFFFECGIRAMGRGQLLLLSLLKLSKFKSGLLCFYQVNPLGHACCMLDKEVCRKWKRMTKLQRILGCQPGLLCPHTNSSSSSLSAPTQFGWKWPLNILHSRPPKLSTPSSLHELSLSSSPAGWTGRDCRGL